MLQIIFYAFLAYLPFQIALNPYPDIDLMSGRVAILILFFWWLWTVRKTIIEKFRQFFNFQGILLIAFLLLAVFSLFQAEEISWGVRKILVFCSIFPLYFLTAGIVKEKEQIQKAIRVLCFSSLPIAIIGILQFFLQFVFLSGHVVNFWLKWISPIFYGRTFGWLVSANLSWMFEIGGKFYLRAVSIFPDSHIFAFYLGLIAPLTLALLLTEKRKKLFGGILFCQIIAVFLTFSRGGYLAMAAFSIVAASFFIKTKVWAVIPVGKRFLTKIIAAATFLAFLFLILVPITPVSKCFYSSFDFSRNSNLERVEIWSEAIKVISLHPWLGVGIGNFPKVFNPEGKYLSPVNTHSTYLDVASEMGIFALWVWLFLFFGTILALIKRKNIILFGLAGSLIWFAVHAVVEVSIYNSTILAILMVIFGLASAAFKRQWDNI